MVSKMLLRVTRSETLESGHVATERVPIAPHSFGTVPSVESDSPALVSLHEEHEVQRGEEATPGGRGPGLGTRKDPLCGLFPWHTPTHSTLAAPSHGGSEPAHSRPVIWVPLHPGGQGGRGHC